MAGGRLEGRRILVTGAASGMGEGVADLFAAEGAQLVLLDVDADRLAAVAARTGQAMLRCDVADEADVAAAVAFAAERLGGLDGLVNVAGVLLAAPVATTSWPDFQRLVSINLGGPFLTCRAALPHLAAADAATIVNVSSLSAVKSQPGMAAYSATKAGLVAFTEALSGELPPNVRVNAVCPGVIRTAMTEFMFAMPGRAEEVAGTLRVGRLGTPRDVASACLYLCCGDSSFVTGATLTVAGGHFR